MSSDILPDVSLRIRCEAISSSISPSAICHRSHDAVLRASVTGRAKMPDDDPAVPIGLALAHIRQGDGLTGIVPEMLAGLLQAHAGRGDPACRVVLDWLERRNSDLLASTKQRSGCRKIRERRQAGPGSLKKRGRKTMRPSDSKTAIIAATTEGRIDE